MKEYIEIESISKSFNGHEVLRDVSLSIKKGRTIGLVGGNGSGKSVLFKILCGFVKPDSGKVFIQGKEIGKKDDFPENIGVFINSPGYIGIYSGYKNLEFLADIRGVIGKKEINSAMQKVGLDPSSKTKVDDYSLGMKQDILVLDEPFNALDFKTYNDIKEIIRILQAEEKTILLTSHNYEDIRELCDEIYIIEDGRMMKLTNELYQKYFHR